MTHGLSKLALAAAALLGVATGAVATGAMAQGGDYTRDLPSVQTVESRLRGADPADTTARQVAVFTYLQSYIQRIKLARDYRGPYTPAEQALMNAYAVAAWQLTQDFGKTHGPAEVKAFQQKEGQYEVNNALDWIKSLEGQGAADTYRGTEASLADSYKQHQDQLQHQMKPGDGANGGSGGGLAGDPVLDPTGAFARAEAGRVNDPQLRRCVELGSPLEACEGMGGLMAFAALLTPAMDKPDPNAPPPAAGVVLAGVWKGGPGQAGLAIETGLSHGQAVVIGCGDLQDSAWDTRDYRLRRAGPDGQMQLVIDNAPVPIVVAVRPDGQLAGPGLVPVTGRVITGYTTTTSRVMVNGARADLQGYNCNGPCSSSSSSPTYGPKTERCGLGLLAPVPRPQNAPVPAERKTGIPMLDALNEHRPFVFGWRMTGRYQGASGLKLEFENGDVILDCGRAHARAPYVIDNTPAGFVVRIQNGGGAFALAAAPDTTLRGDPTATTTVHGRLITAIHGEDPSFAPVAETCPVGTLASVGGRNTAGR